MLPVGRRRADSSLVKYKTKPCLQTLRRMNGIIKVYAEKGPLVEPDARVEHGVEDVGHDVDEDEDEGYQQRSTHYDG